MENKKCAECENYKKLLHEQKMWSVKAATLLEKTLDTIDQVLYHQNGVNRPKLQDLWQEINDFIEVDI